MTQLDKAGDSEWRQHLGPNANGYARVGFAFRNGIAATTKRERKREREIER